MTLRSQPHALPRVLRSLTNISLALFAAISIVACASSDTTSTSSRQSSAMPVAIIDGKPSPAPTIPMGDPATIARIIDEGKNRNQVMDHLRYLTETIGPRLTGSANLETANFWTMHQFASWGLSNAHLDQWGSIPVRFDRGQSWGKVLLREDKREKDGARTVNWKPVRDLQLTTLAWTAGTPNGEPLRGHVVRMPDTREQYEQMKDTLDGAWILVPPPAISGRGPRGPGQMASERYRLRKDAHAKLADPAADLSALLVDELILRHKVLGFVTSSRDERVWTGACPGWRELDPASIPTDVEVMVRLSDYDYINSRITDGEEIQLEFKLDNKFKPGPVPVFNTIAEIPGTTWPDEVVVVSGHLDSWDGPGSQGATDNGTGSAVTLEAARILMAAGAKPKRTIRFILWTGEEQGLLGSRAYVKNNPDLLPKLSAVFVDDGGTNTQGGLLCTRDMTPILAAATAPVNNIFFDDKTNEPLNVNIQPLDDYKPHGGSDHYSFYEAGVPAFFWDEVGRAEYGYGWHTQNDRLDLAIPVYLRQSATCSAITAYNLACAPAPLPRWSTAVAPALEAPSRLSASDGSFSDYILVNWGTVPAAQNYDLYRARTESFGDAEKILTGTDKTTHEDHTAEPGRRYWYWVEARAPQGAPAPSTPARSEKPEAGYRGVPPAILNVTADNATCGQVGLKWDEFSGATRFEIVRTFEDSAPVADTAEVIKIEGDATTWTDDTAPTDPRERFYWLRPVGRSGNGPWSRATAKLTPCP